MRKFSLVIVGLGAFFVVLGPLVRFYAYPRIAVVPVGEEMTSTLVAKDATVFDVESLRPIRSDLSISVHTAGDGTTPARCAGSVTYVNASTTRSADGKVRNQQVERMTFDEHTALPASKCGADFLSTEDGVRTPVISTGLQAKFPFDAQRHDYPFWDSTLKRSFPAVYKGTVSFRGIDLYEYAQDVPRESSSSMTLPSAMVGSAETGTVTAQVMYKNHRIFLVEPETGLIVQVTERRNQAVSYAGRDVLTLMDATASYDERTVERNVELARRGAQLRLMRTSGPWAFSGLGVFLLGLGVVGASRRSDVRRLSLFRAGSRRTPGGAA